MDIDSYAPCPGGTGKKIKFCCSDLIGELGRLETLLSGDQVTAANDLARRLAEKHPGRACLLAVQTKLALATKQYDDASSSSRRFLEAHPGNPLACGQAALTEALAGRMQEAAALLDRGRESLASAGAGAEATLPIRDIVNTAATIVQVAAEMGHSGFAQGIVEWLGERSLATEDDLRLLGAILGSAAVPVPLRPRPPLEEIGEDSPWRFEFDTALGHARNWRLVKALTTFRSLRGVASGSRPLFTNIAILCERLARPMEASEAWLAVARSPGISEDDAIEAVGRAIALETEADPDRSPQVRYATASAALALPAGEEGVRAHELLEDRLRHDPRSEPATIDRGRWTARDAVPPRSAWRVFEAAGNDALPRMLATLLLFGRQTDREPTAMLQGFLPDVLAARPICEELLGCGFGEAVVVEGLPGSSPAAWLLNTQFRIRPPAVPPATPARGEPSVVDTLRQRQRTALWTRVAALWPDTEMPELLGRTPRGALADETGARRVEALISEGEATAIHDDEVEGWAAIRRSLGLAVPAAIESTDPLGELPPLRWHRLKMGDLGLAEVRSLLLTAASGGFNRAARLAAESLAARPDAAPEDRWIALGSLLERGGSSVRTLEIIAELRRLAKQLEADDGMLDVAEVRVRLERGEQAEFARLVEHLQRHHGSDRQVLQAFAEVLAEAGIDLSALERAARGAGAVQPGAMPPAAGAVPGRLWTPGGTPPDAGSGEKKVIWTPG